jgi:hypothetical protein
MSTHIKESENLSLINVRNLVCKENRKNRKRRGCYESTASCKEQTLGVREKEYTAQ